MILEPDKGEAFKASCVPKLLDLVDGFASDLEVRIRSICVFCTSLDYSFRLKF